MNAVSLTAPVLAAPVWANSLKTTAPGVEPTAQSLEGGELLALYRKKRECGAQQMALAVHYSMI